MKTCVACNCPMHMLFPGGSLRTPQLRRQQSSLAGSPETRAIDPPSIVVSRPRQSLAQPNKGLGGSPALVLSSQAVQAWKCGHSTSPNVQAFDSSNKLVRAHFPDSEGSS